MKDIALNQVENVSILASRKQDPLLLPLHGAFPVFQMPKATRNSKTLKD